LPLLSKFYLAVLVIESLSKQEEIGANEVIISTKFRKFLATVHLELAQQVSSVD
jgi:hypothetical protein